MLKTGKKRKFGRHYIRYLISYMTVLLIPLVILTFFYSSRFMKKFYDEIYETVDLELLQISTQLDNELESMLNIVGQLDADRNDTRCLRGGNSTGPEPDHPPICRP